MILKYVFVILLGFGSGAVISGAVFAFIAVIGVVPRLAQKTKTKNSLKLYEEAISFGGIAGCVEGFFKIPIPTHVVIVAALFVCVGIFYGCLAVSLAEVLDVIPILSRRTKLQQGIFFFILAIALGKLTGSILYYVVPGFLNE
ncbi:MAG: stage V sporulation protein AB [Clostridiales bacterium]|jgi:stage V sporulation protein AB|nr:stage V sporulation protein AB [Clostridiales bacterium]